MFRLVAIAAATPLAAAAVPAGAAASGSAITLQNIFAGPIAGNSRVCTAEPRALIYGTRNYSPAQPLAYDSEGFPNSLEYFGYYLPANAPSTLDLAPALQSGARSDFCVGVTLPPDVEEPAVRTLAHLERARLQDNPAYSDLEETHVVPEPITAPAPVGDDLKSVAFQLPAGLTANFGAADQCPQADFGAANYLAPVCEASTQVGDALLRLSTYTTAYKHLVAPDAKVYNLAPGANEVGLFGVVASPGAGLARTKLLVRITFGAANSSRLRASIASVPRTTYLATAIAQLGSVWSGADIITNPSDPRIGQPLPSAAPKQLYLESLGLRTWGSATTHATMSADFTTTGTQCGVDRSVNASASTYGGSDSQLVSASYRLDDCSTLAFHPWATLDADEARPSAATGLSLGLGFDQPTNGRAAAQPAAANLTLPADVQISPRLLTPGGSPALCTADQFNAASLAPSSCPAASRVGDLELNSSLLRAPWPGTIAFGAPAAAGELPRLYLEAAPPGTTAPDAPRVKIAGRLWLADDGTVSVQFPELPMIGLTSLRLAFAPGANAIFETPATCGTHTGSATFTPSSGGEPVLAPLALAMAASCKEAPFGPRLTIGPASQGNGPTVTVERPDGSPGLRDWTIDLPAGFLVNGSAATECSLATATAAACPEASRLAGVRLLLGAGAHPQLLTGSLYLLDHGDGALARATVVVSARDGATDAGTIVFPARVDLRADRAGVSLSTALPARANGIALNLRSVSMDFDRPGLMIEPTACGPLPASAQVASLQGGAPVRAQTTFSAASCSARPFGPAFSAQLSGAMGVKEHPAMRASITPRGGDANLRGASLTFPAGVGLDPAATATRCAPANFTEGTCPASSRVGSVGAQLAVAPDGLGGGLYLVTVPGEALPGLGLNLSGQYAQRLIAPLRLTAAGRLTLTLNELPDLPLSPLALQLVGGAQGVLQMTGTGCSGSTDWSAALTGQGGQSASATIPAACSAAGGGAPTLEVSLKRKTGLKIKLMDFGSLRLQSFKVTMPASVRFKTKVAKRKGNAPIALIGGQAKSAFSSGSLTLRITAGAPTEVVLRVRPEAYQVAKKKPKKAQLRLRLSFTDGSVQTRTVSISP